MFRERISFSELDEDEHYCYGLMSSGIGENRMLGHGGGSSGVHTSCFFYPELNYYIVILSNTDFGANAPKTALNELITDVATG